MAAELVNVEFRKDGDVIKSYSTSFDAGKPDDIEGLTRDVIRHVGMSGPGCEFQIWKRSTGEDLGTYPAEQK